MLDKIKDILVEYVDISREQIGLETDLRHDLRLSSLDMVSIIVAFEDEFAIEISDRKLSEIITVEDVIALLSKEYGIVNK